MMSKKAIKKAKRAEFFSLKEYLYKKHNLGHLSYSFVKLAVMPRKRGSN